jgi:hypothetical protein
MKDFGFHSAVWSEQKLQIVNEMRAVFANKTPSQNVKADFGKLQVLRIKAAFTEAHRGKMRLMSVWCMRDAT